MKYGRDEAEAVMGHQTGLDRVYARFEGQYGDERLASVYVKAVPELSIATVSKELQSQIEELRDENAELKTRLDALTESRGEVDSTMNQLMDDHEFQAFLLKKLKLLMR